MITAMSAPGSLMLFGEHAVLHGQPAIVCAIDRRLRVELKDTTARELTIRSTIGAHTTSMDDPQSHPAFRFVLAAVQPFLDGIHGGLTITIESSFSHTVGFGSSAAVSAAALAAMLARKEEAPLPLDLFHQCRALIRRVQGTASGADAAASVFGGILRFVSEPAGVTQLATPPLALTAIYSGSKTPTADVIRTVRERMDREPAVRDAVYHAIGQVSDAAADAIASGDLERAGRLMDIGQGLMDALGVNTQPLQSCIHALRRDPGIYGAKISGSGLGDCAVGLGHASPSDKDDVILLNTDSEGVKLEQG